MNSKRFELNSPSVLEDQWALSLHGGLINPEGEWVRYRLAMFLLVNVYDSKSALQL